MREECPSASSRGHWLQNVWAAGNGTTCINATVGETEVSVEDDDTEQVKIYVNIVPDIATGEEYSCCFFNQHPSNCTRAEKKLESSSSNLNQPFLQCRSLDKAVIRSYIPSGQGIYCHPLIMPISNTNSS